MDRDSIAFTSALCASAQGKSNDKVRGWGIGGLAGVLMRAVMAQLLLRGTFVKEQASEDIGGDTGARTGICSVHIQ